MKQKSLLKTVFLLAALLVGGTAWGAEGDTHDFSQTLSQLLNNNAAIESITIAEQSYPVKEVIISYTHNKSLTGNFVTASVSVAGTSWGSNSLTCNTTTTSSFTGSSTTGAISISFTNQTGNGTGHGTFKVTNVRLVEGSSTTTPSISASNVNIFDDATNGSIAYTINNPVEGGEMTAARTIDADTWLTVGTVSSTTVAFTTTVNTGAERSTTVRLTYTYDTNKTVTKDVTVTQSAPVAKYTVTIDSPTGGTLVVKNGETTVSSGDRFPEGTVLNVTATAGDRYKFRNWQAVDATTHTYSASNTGTWTMTAHDVTIKANFDAREYHFVTFSVIGTASTPVEYEKGATIVFPSNPADIGIKKFVGWSTTTITGTTDIKPTLVNSALMGDDDVSYFAVFANAEGDGVETVSYVKLTSSDFDADATYVIGAMNGNNLALFYYYNTVDQNASWGKMSTDYSTHPPLTFTLSGTASALYAKDNNGNYLQGDVNDFRMVSESNKAPVVLGNDGKIYNYNSGNTSTRWLRYNTGGDYGIRWYSTSATTGNLAYFYEMIVDPGYTYSAYCTTIPPLTKEVSAAGWATYAPAYPVSFPEGTAYIINSVTTQSDNTKVATLTEVSEVRAGIPVLLKRPESTATVTMTVIASAAAVSGNMLHVSDGTAISGGTPYVLAKPSADDETGFYLWNGNDADLNGKIYLLLPSGARPFIALPGEETEIGDINRETTSNNRYFDLQGRRVAQPTKGLYIVNGKKVMIK